MAKDNDFEMHVLMIKQSDGCTISEAKLRAWMEGPRGLEKRREQAAFDKRAAEIKKGA